MRRSLAVLVVLWIAVSGLHYLWLSINTVPPHWDTAGHMMSALKYRTVLQECSGHFFSLRSIKHCIGEIVYVDQFVYPPLFPLIGALFSFVAGTSVTAFAMTNVLFVAVFMISMYLMGTALHSRLAGVLAAMVMLAYPLVYQTSREFMLEFALLAFIAAAGACLVLSDEFQRPVPTTLFGLIVGLGALTKFNFLVHLLGPGLFVLGRVLADARRGRIDARDTRRRLVTVVDGLALGGAMAAVWYWPHRFGFIGALQTVAAAADLGAPILSVRSLAFYLNAMIWTQMGPPLFLLFVIGAWCFATTRSTRSRGFVLVWIGSIYGIFTALTRKAEHDDLGILVPAALITAIGIASLRRARTPVLVFVATFIALQLAILTLPEPLLGARTGTFGWKGIVTPFPRTEDWKIEPALRTIATRPASVAVISDHIFINGAVFQFYTLKDHLPLAVSPCWKLPTDNGGFIDLSRLDLVIAKSDLAWIHPKRDGCFKGVNGRDEYSVLLRQLTDETRFRLIDELPLPDGSSLLVFRAKIAAPTVQRREFADSPRGGAEHMSGLREFQRRDSGSAFTATPCHRYGDSSVFTAVCFSTRLHLTPRDATAVRLTP